MSGNGGSSAGGFDDVVGEDLYNRTDVKPSGLTSSVKRETPVIGYRRPIRDPRLITYDRAGARSKPPVSWEVTKDDRMSTVEAGKKMVELYNVYQLRGQSPELLEAFHEAVYFGHTMNSASTIQPGRSDVIVNGHAMPFKLLVDYLDSDHRRFFRAFANEVRDLNKRILIRAQHTDDIVAQEKAAWLREVAASRGLSRNPDLAHDSSDCCWNLTDAERSALQASKTMVFATVQNMPDRNRYRSGQSGETAAGSMYVGSPAQPVNALAAH